MRDDEDDEDGEKDGFEEVDGVVVVLRAAPAGIVRVCEGGEDAHCGDGQIGDEERLCVNEWLGRIRVNGVL